MPFWHTPAQQIRSRFNRHFRAPDTSEALADQENRIPPNQTSPWANVPPDILYSICDQAFSETNAHYGVEMLALVCKLWYQIITGYGRPWSIIRIEPYLHRSTVYTTMKSYVNTRLKYSHHYPLDVTIRPVLPDWLGGPNFLQKDIKNAIDAVIGGGLHARRWGTLNAVVHPYVRARLKHPTPILHRVALDGINQYGWDLAGLFPVAPKLQVLSLTGKDSIYYLHLPASTSVTLNNLRLEGFSIYTCVSVLERFVKTQRLTTLELTGTWSHISQRAPVTLPTVRSLTLNARGPICVTFSAIIMPALVQLIVIGGRKTGERQNVLDDRDVFKSIGSKLETLRLESLLFDSEDYLESILVAAPKVKRLTMKDITCDTYDDPFLDGLTSKDSMSRLGEWLTVWGATDKSSEPEYVTLLKNPLVFPALVHCIVDDIDREDLVLLRRQREIG
jgi:hypothetical protein